MVCPLTTLLYPNIYFSFVVKTCLWDVERKNVATGKFTFFFSEKYLKHHLHRIEDNPSNSSVRDKYHLGTYITKYTSTSLRFFSSMYFLSLKYHLKPLFHFYIIVLFRCYVICVSLCPPSIQWRETHFEKSKHPSNILSKCYHPKEPKMFKQIFQIMFPICDALKPCFVILEVTKKPIKTYFIQKIFVY